jgi:hypothetical protein
MKTKIVINTYSLNITRNISKLNVKATFVHVLELNFLCNLCDFCFEKSFLA